MLIIETTGLMYTCVNILSWYIETFDSTRKYSPCQTFQCCLVFITYVFCWVILTCGPFGLVLNSSTRSIRRCGLTVPSITPYFRPIRRKWTATTFSMLVHWDTITLHIRGDIMWITHMMVTKRFFWVNRRNTSRLTHVRSFQMSYMRRCVRIK